MLTIIGPASRLILSRQHYDKERTIHYLNTFLSFSSELSDVDTDTLTYTNSGAALTAQTPTSADTLALALALILTP